MNNMKNILKFYKVKNDVNGNPRYCVHFLDLSHFPQGVATPDTSHVRRYELASARARFLGGRTYRGKDYGGGFVFQSYNLDDLFERINFFCDEVYDGYTDKYGDVKYVNNKGDE
jgi:hypothetical protein